MADKIIFGLNCVNGDNSEVDIAAVCTEGNRPGLMLEGKTFTKDDLGGTKVVANPTLAGSESSLEGLQVGETKYKVPSGTEVTANPTLAGTEGDLTGLQVGETKYKVPSGTEVVANPTLAGTESDLTGLQVGDTKYKIPSGGTSAPKLVAPLAELLDPTTIDITPGNNCLIFNQCQTIDGPDAVMYWWGLVPSEYVNRITEFSSENPLVVTFLVCPTIDNFQYVNSHIGYQDVEVSDLTDPNYLQVLFYWDEDGQQVEGSVVSTITTICTPFDLCTMTIFVSVDEDASESMPLPSVKQNCSNAILSADDCADLFGQFTFSFA